MLIAEKGCKLPFDIANMRTIFFDHTDLESADACREAILEALRSSLAGGIVDSPIGTSIDLSSMSGGNAVERGIADILSTLEDVAREQRNGLESIERSSRRRGPSPAAVADAQIAVERLEEIADILDNPELTEAVEELRRPVRHIARTTGLDFHDRGRMEPIGMRQDGVPRQSLKESLSRSKESASRPKQDAHAGGEAALS